MDSVYKQNGYLIIDNAYNESEVVAMEKQLATSDAAGHRSLLEMPWCASVATELKERIVLTIAELKNKKPVQCTYFQKCEAKNWLVSWHQDRSLPVTDDNVAEGTIRFKDGKPFYQPAEDVLAGTIAVRLSVDSSHSKNGGLKVIPGSHRHGILNELEIERYSSSSSVDAPSVARGSIMIMSPLLLHSSSKSEVNESRRILHYTFV